MKRMILALTLALMASVSYGQKVAYLNSAAVMNLLPEVRAANSELEVFQKQFENRIRAMVEEYQKKGMELQRRIQAGEIAPKFQEEEIAKLQAEEEKIGALEQEMRQKVNEKQEALVTPIIERMQQAIDQVAAAEGYQYIFDASPGQGVLLYADPALDITPKVMELMGIKAELEEDE
jgi:outer membrane protein